MARLVDIVRQRTNEMYDDLTVELGRITPSEPKAPTSSTQRTTTAPSPAKLDSPTRFTLENRAPSGRWEETAHLNDTTYRWPDKNIDDYVDEVHYRGLDGWAGLNLALGFMENGDITGFVVGSGGGSKRGITYFVPADDFVKTRHKVSMIRGGGPNKKSGFAPGEQLPRAYADFDADVLGDRVLGKWNVQSVVVDEHDHDAMLRHTALQAKLRGLG